MKDDKAKPFWDRIIGKWILAIGTIFSFLFAIYMYLKKDAPNVELIIESESCLFNAEEQLSQVKVIVDSVDILSNDENVTIYSMRVENNGTKPVSLYDYDSGDIGVKVFNGRIIETPSLIEASSGYLIDKIKHEFVLREDSVIVLPHVILNVGDDYLLHFCVLHNNHVVPRFESFGQIVGQKRINIIDFNSLDQSDWHRAINGSLTVQLIRLFIYGLSFLVLLVVFAALSHWIKCLFKWLAKETFLYKLKKKSYNNATVIKDYRKHGYNNIEKAYFIKDFDSARLTKLYKDAKACLTSPINDSDENHLRKICEERIRIYNDLFKNGYIFITDDSSVSFNSEIKEVVEAIHGFLLNDRDVRENMGLGYDIWLEEIMIGGPPKQRIKNN